MTLDFAVTATMLMIATTSIIIAIVPNSGTTFAVVTPYFSPVRFVCFVFLFYPHIDVKILQFSRCPTHRFHLVNL